MTSKDEMLRQAILVAAYMCDARDLTDDEAEIAAHVNVKDLLRRLRELGFSSETPAPQAFEFKCCGCESMLRIGSNEPFKLIAWGCLHCQTQNNAAGVIDPKTYERATPKTPAPLVERLTAIIEPWLGVRGDLIPPSVTALVPIVNELRGAVKTPVPRARRGADDPDVAVRCRCCMQELLDGEVWTFARQCCEEGRQSDLARGVPDPRPARHKPECAAYNGEIGFEEWRALHMRR